MTSARARARAESQTHQVDLTQVEDQHLDREVDLGWLQLYVDTLS